MAFAKLSRRNHGARTLPLIQKCVDCSRFPEGLEAIILFPRDTLY